MTDSDERSVSISRRQFLAGVGATSAGAAAIGSAATDDPTLALGSTEPMPINERFNIDDYRIGPLGERPAAADVKGGVYEVTDNNASNGTLRTFSDGAQWVTLNVEADVVDTEDLNNTRVAVEPSSQTEINDAIASLPASGGEVVISAPPDTQTVVIDGPITDQGKSNVTIRGQGQQYTRMKVKNNTISQGFDIQADGWTIRDLEVDGNEANQPDSEDKQAQVGILGRDCNDFSVINCYVHDTVYSNIRHIARNQSTTGVRLLNNITARTRTALTPTSDNLSLTTRNTYTNQQFLLRGNYCLDCGWEAIEMSGGVGYGTIDSNVIVNPLRSHLSIHDGTSIVCSNNILKGGNSEGNGAIAMTSSRSAAIGNVIEVPQDVPDGIYVNGYTTATASDDDIIIADNFIKGGQVGIQLANGSATISNNRVFETVNKGIELQSGADEARVNNNYVRNAGDDGIVVSGGEVLVNGNRVVNPAARAIETNTPAVVSNNVVDAPSSSAIVIFGNDSQSIGNAVRNASVTAVSLKGDNIVSVGDRADNSDYGFEFAGIDCDVWAGKGSGNVTSFLLNNGGTRPRWHGVIGGGTLGGTDLGTTTGQFVGDQAMADGTTGTAYLYARWTGTGWQQSDGSAAI